MNLNELKEKLLRDAAWARLSDLNDERQNLHKILGLNENGRVLVVPKQIINAVKAVKEINKKKHWTQTKYGRRKMAEILKARRAAGWNPHKNGKTK